MTDTSSVFEDIFVRLLPHGYSATPFNYILDLIPITETMSDLSQLVDTILLAESTDFIPLSPRKSSFDLIQLTSYSTAIAT